VAILFNPDRLLTGSGLIESVESAATTLGTTTVRTAFRNSAEIESAVEAFAAEPNGALILLGAPPAEFAIIQHLALKHRLPLAYQLTGDGVLISYAADVSDLVRGAASYIDRILRGGKISELPVQFPTKFELIVNLKAATAIGLTIPESLLFRADEVIR
jgi:putative ABC transport system substrate-binding protein